MHTSIQHTATKDQTTGHTRMRTLPYLNIGFVFLHLPSGSCQCEVKQCKPHAWVPHCPYSYSVFANTVQICSPPSTPPHPTPHAPIQIVQKHKKLVWCRPETLKIWKSTWNTAGPTPLGNKPFPNYRFQSGGWKRNWKHTVSTAIRVGNGPFPLQSVLETGCFQTTVSNLGVGNGIGNAWFSKCSLRGKDLAKK